MPKYSTYYDGKPVLAEPSWGDYIPVLDVSDKTESTKGSWKVQSTSLQPYSTYQYDVGDPNPPSPPDGTGTYSVYQEIYDINDTLLSTWGYFGSDLFQWGSEARGGKGSFFTTKSTGNGGSGPPRQPGYVYNLWYQSDGGEGDKGLTWVRDGCTFRVSADGTDLDALYLQYNDGDDNNETDYVDQWHDGTDYNIKGTNTTDINITGVTNVNLGGNPLIAIVTSTTSALADVANAINTSDAKQAGYQVFNTTTSKPVWAVGAADASVWVDATGATAHTPV